MDEQLGVFLVVYGPLLAGSGAFALVVLSTWRRLPMWGRIPIWITGVALLMWLLWSNIIQPML